MAKEKTQVDVDLARIKADIEIARIHTDLENAKSRYRSTTIQWGLSLFFLTTMIGIIASAAVRISEKPAWLTFASAILATATAPSFVLWRVYVRVVRRTKTDAALARKEPVSGTGESS